ncbi:MAG: hypothetical protein JST42_15535 [Bacteroidetes bacterium]|nr:hypothetical protein [Bacteroidota bacterium]
MPYPKPRGRNLSFLVLIALLAAPGAQASPSSKNYFHSAFWRSHNSPRYALYIKRDNPPGGLSSGYVRRNANGDLVITVPQNTAGRYKIRFFDEHRMLLFEIRQIRDPMLIVEKYNFEHAGQFVYELYRDAVLVETTKFSIRKE